MNFKEFWKIFFHHQNEEFSSLIQLYLNRKFFTNVLLNLRFGKFWKSFVTRILLFIVILRNRPSEKRPFRCFTLWPRAPYNISDTVLWINVSFLSHISTLENLQWLIENYFNYFERSCTLTEIYYLYNFTIVKYMIRRTPPKAKSFSKK